MRQCFVWIASHQDESEHREDVVEGVSEEGPPCQSDGLRREILNVSVRSLSNRWQRLVKAFLYLSCKDPAQADDDQDVEDGRADDRADSDVSFSDEDTWGRVSQSEQENII